MPHILSFSFSSPPMCAIRVEEDRKRRTAAVAAPVLPFPLPLLTLTVIPENLQTVPQALCAGKEFHPASGNLSYEKKPLVPLPSCTIKSWDRERVEKVLAAKRRKKLSKSEKSFACPCWKWSFTLTDCASSLSSLNLRVTECYYPLAPSASLENTIFHSCFTESTSCRMEIPILLSFLSISLSLIKSSNLEFFVLLPSFAWIIQSGTMEWNAKVPTLVVFLGLVQLPVVLVLHSSTDSSGHKMKEENTLTTIHSSFSSVTVKCLRVRWVILLLLLSLLSCLWVMVHNGT